MRGFNVCHAKEQIDKPASPFLKRPWVKEDASLGEQYPFNLPWLDKDFLLDFATPVTIIVGENGTGKSTLIEAVAALCGFDEAGGGKGYMPVDHSRAVDRSGALLATALRAAWLPEVTAGWFFRAESYIMQMTGNTILITGGTSGIGRGLAEAFHKLDNQVIIAGRRQSRLDEITAANPGMIGIQLDVQDPQAIDAFTARVREKIPELNVLINNAGISRPETLPGGSDLSIARNIIETNIIGVLHMTAALLPALVTKPQATIITTTSGLAFVPRNNFPTYCASKAFLHSWLQSLRVQLRGSSLEVLELAPPYVQTELGGPHQLSDPHAMPLAASISEVMQLLSNAHPPDGEILVERVRGERFAERNGDYARRFAIFNGL